MYYSKSSGERLSQFAKSTKNFLLYGNTSTDQNQKQYYQVKVDPKPEEMSTAKVEKYVKVSSNQMNAQETNAFTDTDLQQAIIWSEILGKPMCKRRERRNYVN